MTSADAEADVLYLQIIRFFFFFSNNFFSNHLDFLIIMMDVLITKGPLEVGEERRERGGEDKGEA